jgi:hypothetical protein
MSEEINKNTDDKTKAQAEIAPFSWIESEEGVCEAYSNFIHMNWTLYDVRIKFGQIIPHPEQQPGAAVWAISDQAALTIPWGQAKVLRGMLDEAVSKYEALNGEITVPKLPT